MDFVRKTRALLESMQAPQNEAADKPVDKAHFCATHVEHSIYGLGQCIKESHAEPDTEGQIAWYNVQFEDGIHRVDTAAMKILHAESHTHSKKKAMKEEEEVEQTNEAKLHPNQQNLDVHEPEKDELTAKDFEMLRKSKKAMKESVTIDVTTTYEMTEQVSIPINPTFADYLSAVETLVNDAEVDQAELVNLAQEAYANKETDILVKAELQAMNEAGAIKVQTPTGMRVMGTRYGNSAEAERNRTKKFIDTMVGPTKAAMDNMVKTGKKDNK